MKENRINIILVVLVAAALLLASFALLRTSPAQVETLGTSNFNDIQADSVSAANVTASSNLVIKAITQTGAVVGINADGAVNGSKFPHGLPGAPTYPTCSLYTPIFPVTATVYVSAANATSITLAIVNFDGTPYTGSSLAVRCTAIYVP